MSKGAETLNEIAVDCRLVGLIASPLTRLTTAFLLHPACHAWPGIWQIGARQHIAGLLLHGLYLSYI